MKTSGLIPFSGAEHPPASYEIEAREARRLTVCEWYVKRKGNA